MLEEIVQIVDRFHCRWSGLPGPVFVFQMQLMGFHHLSWRVQHDRDDADSSGVFVEVTDQDQFKNRMS